jgi:hypothetical protein
MAEDEEPGERLDRELIELLNGLRVILPGAQVLFAFLLTVPFTQRFPDTDTAQRTAYFAGFLCTAIASALLLAPSAYHRLRWRQRDKEQLLRTANTLVIAALGFLAVAITAATFLVTNLLYDGLATSIVSAGVAVLLVWFWYGLPLSRRARDLRNGNGGERDA